MCGGSVRRCCSRQASLIHDAHGTAAAEVPVRLALGDLPDLPRDATSGPSPPC